MRTPNKRAKLLVQIQQDLVERSKQGIWAHPLCLILALATTGLAHRAPMLMCLTTVCVLTQAGLRFVLLAAIEGLPGQQRVRSWDRAHALLLLSCTTVWGLVPGAAIAMFGYNDRDVLMLLLYHAVVTFGTINLLVHNQRLMGIAIGLLFLPLMLGHLFSGELHVLSYLSAAGVFLLYCVGQGRKLHHLYRQQISDSYDMAVAAYHDCLTGLPNRLYLTEALETVVGEAARENRQIALLYIDLDGFKQINDQHSHKIGDLFLCEAAARISKCIRETDVAARIGGDEFTILLPECSSRADAVRLAERILWSAREPMVINGKRLRYSTSIGVSLFPEMAATADLLVRSADEAMYLAKTSGKDRVCVAPATRYEISGDSLNAARSLGSANALVRCEVPVTIVAPSELLPLPLEVIGHWGEMARLQPLMH